MKPKKELVRIVKSPEGEISLDLTGKKNGRGAYICKSRECLAKARKAKRLEKALETQILLIWRKGKKPLPAVQDFIAVCQGESGLSSPL